MIDLRLLEDICRESIEGASDVSFARKAKLLSKFGRSDAVNSSGWTTLATGPNPNHDLLTSNDVDTISSASASDTGTVLVEGATTDGVGHMSFVPLHEVTLNGQTPVALPTAFRTPTRVKALEPLNGDVYLYSGGSSGVTAGVPTDTSRVFMHVPADATGQRLNRSRKCQTVISDVDVWPITALVFTLLRSGTNRNVAFELQERERGSQSWTTILDAELATTGTSSFHVPLEVPILILPSSDVRVQARSTAGSGIECSARMAGPLASVRY